MALYSCLLSGIKEYAKTHVRTEPPNHAELGALVYSGNVDSKHDDFKTVALQCMAQAGVVIPLGYPGEFAVTFPHVAVQAEALLRGHPLPPFPRPIPAQTAAASQPSPPPTSTPQPPVGTVSNTTGPPPAPIKEVPKSEATSHPQLRPQQSSGGTPSGPKFAWSGGGEGVEYKLGPEAVELLLARGMLLHKVEKDGEEENLG
ncbi:uncharacterized protein K444DRAFT_624239 [Hyaloscypha bicolor E]|uniref:Uncharacterized protein n=1 Tax=Hyaloscypha bicolor E TaxID=1095630 RepID=A0A2J6TUS1_9HELO|nr:uncharacterized protein K444DRAFT_624239 [Hyaloscypha bicolor E]PMD66756.1 hypothetical protein K444DRAFT_624239 [Hyaloscypha bicolor E]